MKTREIWHEILINASPEKLYRALTEVDQLSHWWTTDTRGQSAVGSHLEFWFSGFLGSVMKVIELKPGELVRWQAIDQGLPDWIDTRLEFNIFTEKNQTVLHFRHSNWRDDAKLFPHCSLGWAIYLLSLKEFVETGKGRPYPYDLPINLWAPPAVQTAEART
ncbi:MAG TPA: SRPBCC domain-containing protein [Candidatus Acidoferrum sp.]|nr:SRPBCC domain-containing protein [Candidatus Acidoferrum sp.]